ncbi:YtxH domain-containing protein, partial [Staphylococcus aureus]|uniref:YtxH domain-containing protein n=1 Tax=Staphylococcus aureus TaxID=1280 RepID=UPI0024A678C5
KQVTEWEGFIPVLMGIVTAFTTYYTIQGLVWARQKLMLAAQLLYNKAIKAAIAIKRAYIVAMLAFNAAGGGMKGVLAVLRMGVLKLNVAMVANPIGLVIALLAGLVVGLVIAYKRSETFRKIVNKAWSSIKTTAKAVFGWFKDELPKLLQRFKDWADGVYSSTVGGIRNMRDKVIGFFKNLIDGANNMYKKTISAI